MNGMGLRRFVRPAYAAFCVALALLAVIPPPTYQLWRVSILVNEYGHVLALAALLALLPGWRRTRAGRVAAALAVVAAVCALSPLARGVVAARAARAELSAAFGETPAGAPLRIQPLVVGSRLLPITPRTESYAGGDGRPLALDIYDDTRSNGGARPLVVVIHGGSWSGGDRRQLPKLNSYLVRRGYVVASLDYRLAPEHPYPAALEDVGAAVAHLKARAPVLGIDATRIVLLGRSAGGHLALLAAYTLHDPAIRGVVSYYGPADLRWGWHNPSPPLVYDSRAVQRAFLGGTLQQRGVVYDEASPIRHVRTAVPSLLIHGNRDPLVAPEHARRLRTAGRAAGTRIAWIRLPWATHGCDFVFNGPCGQISTWAVDRFLAAVLR